ncbi:hypothetical protein PTI98_001155 [Pleurotus ostreatus]|nr:hypothetical protein PTI98_001155 [Pleurotus ostreatus]
MSPSDAQRPTDIRKISVGGGRIVLNKLAGQIVTFAELSSTYPLKLLSPKVTEDGVAVVYALTYGGGLVGGDRVNLSVEVGAATSLVLLTQGSTKVFKTRPGDRLSSLPTQFPRPAHESTSPTTQIMNFAVAPSAALFLLPEPVTCFRSAAYNQVQTFHLAANASAVILDWFTSGRKSLGEEWVFSRYYSANDIWVEDKRVAKDVMLLEDDPVDASPLPRRQLRDKLAPYACFATAFLFGPLVQPAIKKLSCRYETIQVFKCTAPDKLIWSLSLVDDGAGAIVRTAGLEPEDVKMWLKEALRDVEELIGVDTYRRAFA